MMKVGANVKVCITDSDGVVIEHFVVVLSEDDCPEVTNVELAQDVAEMISGNFATFDSLQDAEKELAHA
jgi:hypothetical protein